MSGDENPDGDAGIPTSAHGACAEVQTLRIRTPPTSACLLLASPVLSTVARFFGRSGCRHHKRTFLGAPGILCDPCVMGGIVSVANCYFFLSLAFLLISMRLARRVPLQ